MSLILADMVLSGVADTLVLPYAIYLQSERESVVATGLSDRSRISLLTYGDSNLSAEQRRWLYHA
ncbi:YceK/YidQ family lipoprotein [Pseudomonas viridiflava]|uniref:YceK/YidQ family lipoprotein n=1 Tax=Pseudomonas viridiflava TaxID=33069 RepID=UPI0013E0CFE4